MFRRSWLCVALSFGTFPSLGCGGEYEASRANRESQTEAGAGARPALDVVAGVDAPAAPVVKQAAGNAPVAGADKAAAVERKIIYAARLDLVVPDLDKATKAVDDTLAAHAGRLVRSETRSDTGARRTGTFTLEVPVDKFRGLVAALKVLGVPERDGIDSQDVTEEYVDVESRVRNLRVEEETLNRLLKEKAGNVTETLAIRTQIVPVREGIERAEGRMKYLSTRAAYSTVTLTLREVADYKPTTAPTFGDRVSRTFSGSWAALKAFGEGVVLFAVAASIWLPLLIPVGVAAVWGLRRAVRSANAAKAPLPVARARRPEPPTGLEEIDPNRTTPI